MRPPRNRAELPHVYHQRLPTSTEENCRNPGTLAGVRVCVCVHFSMIVGTLFIVRSASWVGRCGGIKMSKCWRKYFRKCEHNLCFHKIAAHIHTLISAGHLSPLSPDTMLKTCIPTCKIISAEKLKAGQSRNTFNIVSGEAGAMIKLHPSFTCENLSVNNNE